MNLEEVIRPVVETMGLELVEVAMVRESGRRVLRVFVDREGGVDLDTVAEASERIGRRLDLEGFQPGPGPYSLEVSSPGVERPLRRQDEFRRHVGERVKVRTRSPVDGASVHTGRLVAAGETDVTVATDGGEVTLSYDDISSARTVFEWGVRR